MTTPMNRLHAIADVTAELDRQFQKWGKQNHSFPFYLAILMEEVGEACRAYLENKPGAQWEIHKELIQVAAVAVAMAECARDNQWGAIDGPDEANAMRFAAISTAAQGHQSAIVGIDPRYGSAALHDVQELRRRYEDVLQRLPEAERLAHLGLAPEQHAG